MSSVSCGVRRFVLKGGIWARGTLDCGPSRSNSDGVDEFVARDAAPSFNGVVNGGVDCLGRGVLDRDVSCLAGAGAFATGTNSDFASCSATFLRRALYLSPRADSVTDSRCNGDVLSELDIEGAVKGEKDGALGSSSSSAGSWPSSRCLDGRCLGDRF